MTHRLQKKGGKGLVQWEHFLGILINVRISVYTLSVGLEYGYDLPMSYTKF